MAFDINSIRTTIGESMLDDYKLRPDDHANQYRDKAPELSALLESSAVKSLLLKRREYAEFAAKYKNRYLGFSRGTNWSILLAGLSGAAIMGLTVLSGATEDHEAIISTSWVNSGTVILGILGMIAGAVGGFCMNLLRRGKYLEKWMEQRSRAETLRLRYFNLITAISRKTIKEEDIRCRLFQLEYFRRYQLEMQLNFYRNRGKEHRFSFERLLWQGAFALLIVAIANGLSGILVPVNSFWASLAVIAVLFQVIASKINTQEKINQDERNAERYQRTYDTLVDLSSRLDMVRQSILQGETEAFSLFVEAVHEQISLEHRQWLKDQDGAAKTMENLQNQLNKVQKRDE